MLKKVLTNEGEIKLNIIVIIAALSALCGIIIWIFFFEFDQLASVRNVKRQADVRTIAEGIYRYALDHNSSFPAEIPKEERYICKTNQENCQNFVDLSNLTNNNYYFKEIPIDPKTENKINTGYSIRATGRGRIIVYAPYAENGKKIFIIK